MMAFGVWGRHCFAYILKRLATVQTRSEGDFVEDKMTDTLILVGRP